MDYPSQALDHAPDRHVTVSVEVQSIDQGRALAIEEMRQKFPGTTLNILSDRIIVGKGYEADVSISDPRSPSPTSIRQSALPESGNEAPESEESEGERSGPSIPRIIMVLSGDDKTWGLPHAPYQDRTPPFLVATVGDTEDHRLTDKRWQKALKGDAPLWDGYLAIKYRTNTVALLNGDHYIIEQGDLAVECDGPLTQKTAVACLMNSSNEQ